MCSHLMPIRWLAVVCDIARITESAISAKNDTSWISMDFLRFETAKPLQTFSTSTALRVRRSVHFLGHHSPRNIRKTTKIKQNTIEKRIQNQANLIRNWILEIQSPLKKRTLGVPYRQMWIGYQQVNPIFVTKPTQH